MITQILFPSEYDKLSDNDKKLAEDLIKSIVQAEEATNILLDLLDSKDLDSDLPKFRENCQKYFDQKLNLEIFNSSGNSAHIAALPINNTNIANDDVPPAPPAPPNPVVANFGTLLEKVTRKVGNALSHSSDIIRCKQSCQRDPSSQECKDCEPILKKKK